MRALRHRDFRILWIGALLSFTGTFVQNIAQSWLIYELTHDKAMLGLVMFCQSAPVALVGPIAGTLADTFDKRKVLVITQAAFGLGALTLGLAVHFQFIRYELILLIATINGFFAAVEMPTRQTVISRVVPPEDLPSAIPLQAMTFNLARVVGPSIGGILLAAFGPKTCYFVNSLSYLGLITSALTIKADLSSFKQEAAGIVELIQEGIRFTFSDVRLRTLFIMESIVSGCGLVYIAIMPAIAKDQLRLDQRGLGFAMSAIGIGAITGLLLLTRNPTPARRVFAVRTAMTSMGIGMVLFSFVRDPILAYPLLGLMGMSTIVQFNTTNTMFQLISPDRLRGRVIAMHMWALSGVGPFGTLLFSWISHETSIQFAMISGGICVLAGAIWGWTQRATFTLLARSAESGKPAIQTT